MFNNLKARFTALSLALVGSLAATPVMAVVDLTPLDTLEADLASMTPKFVAVAIAFAITGWVVARII